MEYEEIETYVGSNSAQNVHQKLNELSTQERDDCLHAISVHIAIGERQDLEKTFPDLAGANPANHNWE